VIVDAHHHLWDPAARTYPWLTGPGLVAGVVAGST
jgi:L-fuconolactonase